MATILEFRPQLDEARRPARRNRRERSAEIVIFPGIRYERWLDAEAGPAKASPPRDILKICD